MSPIGSKEAFRPTERFSTRVGNYVLYRPGYPDGVLDVLGDGIGLDNAWVVADIGSGTGLLTEVFLRNGNTVIAVEPNADMRAAGEAALKAYPTFHSRAGRAEATGLPAHSIDLVTAGQAFHWFDPKDAMAEFARILKPGGWVALIWNHKDLSAPFTDAYESFLVNYCTEYKHVSALDTGDAELEALFTSGSFAKATLSNAQTFDFEGLRGRFLSASYAPQLGDCPYARTIQRLREIYNEYERNDRVRIDYKTEVYTGRLD